MYDELAPSPEGTYVGRYLVSYLCIAWGGFVSHESQRCGVITTESAILKRVVFTVSLSTSFRHYFPISPTKPQHIDHRDLAKGCAHHGYVALKKQKGSSRQTRTSCSSALETWERNVTRRGGGRFQPPAAVASATRCHRTRIPPNDLPVATLYGYHRPGNDLHRLVPWLLHLDAFTTGVA